jgi:hypothetical protein
MIVELKVSEARDAYLEASRDRKVLDKVKERRAKEYRKLMLTEETNVLDDISGGVPARLGQAAGELFLRFRKRDGFLVTRPQGNMVILKTKAANP